MAAEASLLLHALCPYYYVLCSFGNYHTNSMLFMSFGYRWYCFMCHGLCSMAAGVYRVGLLLHALCPSLFLW